MVHCSVLGCNSRSERKIDNITFHSYPRDANIRRLWIESTGKQNWEPTKYTRMCSRHFEQQCFRKTKSSTYLYVNTIPTLHIHSASVCKNQEETASESSTAVEAVAESSTALEARSPRIESSKSSVDITPRKKNLLTQLDRKTRLAETRKKKIAVLRSKSRRLQRRNAELSAVIKQLQAKHFINQETADLLMSDTDDTDFLNPSKSKFSPNVRKFALNLHFISPRAYNFVRKSFNTCLPHTRTLARWYELVDGEPGFSTESLKTVKLLASTTSKTILCGVCFDEMALRKSVQWNDKNYVGFVNFGNQMENEIAKEALVFMLTCLNGSWKLPLGYFLVAGVTAEQKASLLKTCIDLVSECGVDVVSVTFDGCPANFSMAKLLLCNLDRR